MSQLITYVDGPHKGKTERVSLGTDVIHAPVSSADSKCGWVNLTYVRCGKNQFRLSPSSYGVAIPAGVTAEKGV